MRVSRDERRRLREHFTSVLCHEQTLGLNPAELHLAENPAFISPFEDMGWLAHEQKCREMTNFDCSCRQELVLHQACEDQR